MFCCALLRFFLTIQIMCFSLFAIGSTPPVSRLLSLDIQAKHKDDATLVRAAAGFVVGKPLAESDIQTALAAVELTDRFRKVDISLVPKADGAVVNILVDLWPIVKRVVWQGDVVHNPIITRHMRGLQAGLRPGNLRLATWSRELQMKLVDVGYPDAKVFWIRERDDKQLTITIRAGAGVLLRKLDVIGDPTPYTVDEIRHFTKLSPGRTLWTASRQQETIRNIYRIMQSHSRYEAKIDCQWDGNGTLIVSVIPGPRVSLKVEGGGIDWLSQIRHLIPLASSEYYSPELLCEGDRRIVRYLQSHGYLDAKVWHRRQEFNSNNASRRVTITYKICRGRRHYLSNIRFIGNTAFDEKELKHAIQTSIGLLFLKRQIVSPDFLDALEVKIKSFYLRHGYSDVSLRRQLEYQNGKNKLTFKVKEGPQQLLKWLRLELPSVWFGDPCILGQHLALILLDKPRYPSDLKAVKQYRYSSDRPQLKHIHGYLSFFDDAASKTMVFNLTFNKAIPLVRGDLARVINAIKQQCLPPASVVRQLINLRLETVDGAVGACIKIPFRPIDHMQRLVVTGIDKTKPKAVFREIKLRSNLPLDNNSLNTIQNGLNSSSSFQRVDVHGLLGQECTIVANGAETPTTSWGSGDLQLVLEEGPPYVVNGSFGYDKNQGYRIGLGLNQLNVGGMGRTIGYGICVGNGFIKSPVLAKMFPVGMHSRALDSVTASYTDPWFAPGLFKHLLADRTQYTVEAAYLRECSEVLLYRRRLLNTLQWSVGQDLMFHLGHRLEQIDNTSKLLGHVKSKSSISAPFVQLVKDTRDSAVDPSNGMHSMLRVEFASHPLFSIDKDSFVKLDLKNQWVWSFGSNVDKNGILVLGLRVGLATKSIPRSERFFAGGSFSLRGLEPDTLGPKVRDELITCIGTDSKTSECDAPTGGQGLILINMEYRFPCLGRSIWGEMFVDSGQVYRSLSHHSDVPRSSFRTALGLGLIFKFGVPVKIEYAIDLNRILGRKKHGEYGDNHNLQLSIGYQF